LAGGTVLRLLTFRPEGDGSLADAELRAAANALGGRPLIALYVGRRQETAPERVLATIWPSAEQMTTSLGTVDPAEGPGDLERVPGMTDVRVDVLPVAVALRFDRPDEMLVLRIYRGRVRSGELDAYVEEARAGTIEDDAAGHGPLALYLAIAVPDRFVTLSAWTEWDRIQEATGGNVHNPVATRFPDRLLEGEVRHYEILRPAEAPRERGVDPSPRARPGPASA
jgi:hypothetical protein